MEKYKFPKLRDQVALPFWNLMKVARNSAFDNFTLTLTWTVKDLSRFHELEEKFPYCEIGFKKHNGKRQEILLRVSKDFVKTAKTEINKIIDEQVEANLKDGCIFWVS